MDLAIVEDELPQGPTEPDGPDGPNVTNAQPQIDLNEDIEMPDVQPQAQPDTVNTLQNVNQTNEQQAQLQQEAQQQQQSIQQDLDPVDQHPNTIQEYRGANTNQNQASAHPALASEIPARSSVRSRVQRHRRRDPLKLAIGRLGRIRKRAKPRQRTVSQIFCSHANESAFCFVDINFTLKKICE